MNLEIMKIQCEAYWQAENAYPARELANIAPVLLARDVIRDVPALIAEVKRLQREVIKLAQEGVEREKTLARLEAEVMAACAAMEETP